MNNNTPQAKHTPSPWKHDDGHIFTNEEGREYNSIARIYDIQDSNGNVESNANIIVLAPKMKEDSIELLQKIRDAFKQHDYIFRNREDFVEGRTTWDNLAEISECFYWLLSEIESKMEKY